MRTLERGYGKTRRRILDLVQDLDAEAADAPVPACPGWSIHDVIAHVTGNCTSIITGEFADAAKPEWTAQQVEARKHMTLADVLAEWDATAPQIAAIIDDFPGRTGTQVLGDLTVHEHDLRGALGRPGARDTDAVSMATNFLVTTFLDRGAAMFGLGPLEVKTEDRNWIVGTGDPPVGEVDQRAAWQSVVFSTEPESEPDPPPAPVAHVGVGRFELFRAVSGRRSADQIRNFHWSVDPEPYLPMFDFDPFMLRPTDLVE